MYNTIMHAIAIKQHKLFFLGAPGRSGKKCFQLLLILAKIRLKNGIILGNASSKIAATFLDGNTFYSYTTV